MKSIVHKSFAIAAAALLAISTRGMTIHEVTLNITPTDPYLNEVAALELRMVVSPGAMLRAPRLDGLPDASLLDISDLYERPAETLRQNGRIVEVRRYSAHVRPLKITHLEFRPVLRATLAQRHGSGSMNVWVEQSLVRELGTHRLHVRALPEADRPEHFGGAIGRFSIEGALDPHETEPGGLVTLHAEVHGHGWLGDTLPWFSYPSPDLSIYPPRIAERDAYRRIRFEQTLVPRSMDVTHTPPLVFPYFDPETDRYREAILAPLSLTVHELPETVASDPVAIPIEHSVRTTRRRFPRFLPTYLVPGSEAAARHTVFLVGVTALLVIMLRVHRPMRRRFGRRSSVILMVAGILLSLLAAYRVTNAYKHASFRLPAAATLRLAPAPNAMPIDQLPAGEPLFILESHGPWRRVRAGDQIGWITNPNSHQKKE